MIDYVMSHIIPAIFESGVFRPLVPVNLKDGTPVEVGIPAPPRGAVDPVAWQEYVALMESLPDDSPRDGFSNRDHDRLIYGE